MPKNKMKARTFRRLLNWYPPFLFNRIQVKHISEDYKEMDIVIKKSIWNKNLAGTIFGGTLFSGADPFYPLMYWQIFAHRFDEHVYVWLKSASIDYLKPSDSHMRLEFRISEEDIAAAKDSMETRGKHNANHEVNLVDSKGVVCARVNIVAYVGKRN